MVYPNIFPDIDVHYASDSGSIKIDFVVKPYADPSDIELVFEGQTGLTVNGNNELEIETPLGNVLLPQPRAYQIIDGDEVELEWTPQFIVDDDVVTFLVDTFQTDKPLIISNRRIPEDPSESCDFWSTYFGHSSLDIINAVTISSSTDFGAEGSNIFVTGYTASGVGFPVTSGAFQGALKGFKDAFAFKFDRYGILLWGTYYGGGTSEGIAQGDDKAYDIATDNIGNVYFVGATGSETFPKKQNPPAYYDGVFQPISEFSRMSRSFIVKLAQSSGARIWATHFGEYLSRNETITAVKVIAGNHLVVGGYMQISDTGLYPHFPFETPTGAHYENEGNNFIAEFDEQNQVIWATLFNTGEFVSGGNHASNQIMDITSDYEDNLFITGSTSELNEGDPFITFNNEGGDVWNDYGGGTDAFIAKFNSTRTMTWETFFGGTGNDVGSSIDCDSEGNLFVSGNTTSSDFPTKYLSGTGVYNDNSINGGSDLFISKFSNNGSQVWTTYFGGSGNDKNDVEIITYLDICKKYGGSSLAIDDDGNIFITGQTDSPDLPVNTTPCAPECYYYEDLNKNDGNTNTDAFILVLTPALRKQFLTYWGGNNSGMGEGEGDHGLGIATIGNTNVVFVGSTISKEPKIPLDKLVANAYYKDANLGNYDGLIVELELVGIFECDPPLGVDDLKNPSKNIKVYPVPGNDQIFIETMTALTGYPTDIVITNLLGQVVYQRRVEGFLEGVPKTLDISQLPAGNYFLNVTDSRTNTSIKIIKQ